MSSDRKIVDAELLSLKAELAAELAGALRIHDINSRLLGKLALRELLDEVLDAAIEVTEADFGNIQ